MGLREQVQHWTKEDLKSFEDIEKDILELKKCNQQNKVLRLHHEELLGLKTKPQSEIKSIVSN